MSFMVPITSTEPWTPQLRTRPLHPRCEHNFQPRLQVHSYSCHLIIKWVYSNHQAVTHTLTFWLDSLHHRFHVVSLTVWPTENGRPVKLPCLCPSAHWARHLRMSQKKGYQRQRVSYPTDRENREESRMRSEECHRQEMSDLFPRFLRRSEVW